MRWRVVHLSGVIPPGSDGVAECGATFEAEPDHPAIAVWAETGLIAEVDDGDADGETGARRKSRPKPQE